MRIWRINLVQHGCHLGNFWNLHRFESAIRDWFEMWKLVVSLFTRAIAVGSSSPKFLDPFKGIVLVIMVRELKEQKCLKELAEVVTESIVWFMRFIRSTLITALVDLMKQVVEFSDVVSQIWRHQEIWLAPPFLSTMKCWYPPWFSH